MNTLRPMECAIYGMFGYWWLIVRNPETGETQELSIVSARKVEQLKAIGIPEVAAP